MLPEPRDRRRYLDALHAEFARRDFIERDPLGLVDLTLPPADLELVSFLVAGLSYGRVAQIQQSTISLYQTFRRLGLGPAGEGLADWLRATPEPLRLRELRRTLRGWKHRMNTPEDLQGILGGLATIIATHGSLCRLYQSCEASTVKGEASQQSAEQSLARFCADLVRASAPYAPPANKRPGAKWRGTGPAWFASSPAGGGTCKRLLMWLRWMVRQDGVDPGPWQHTSLVDTRLPRPSSARLYHPVDTHIFRWAREAGILSVKTPTWKSVVTITEFFRTINPEDPVKYDFALCHAGMHQLKLP
jgi:uncharacterized protein (TIGR02757 family)